MKRRFANQVEGDYYQYRLVSKYFTGYVCLIKLKNIQTPLIVNNEAETICIKNNNYEWFELYPDNGKYVLTIMFDDNNNLIEWYFDISKNIGLENGIPYEDDLYLDMIITPKGEAVVLDEDELLNAQKNGDITKDDVDYAYRTLKFLKEKYVNDFASLRAFTSELKEKFDIQKNKNMEAK